MNGSKIKNMWKQMLIILFVLLFVLLPAFIGWTNVYPID
tara:strand:- start:1671 stop:1787 length:117 start_codon:yes stop_codon:yes gene_type:complete